MRLTGGWSQRSASDAMPELASGQKSPYIPYRGRKDSALPPFPGSRASKPCFPRVRAIIILHGNCSLLRGRNDRLRPIPIRASLSLHASCRPSAARYDSSNNSRIRLRSSALDTGRPVARNREPARSRISGEKSSSRTFTLTPMPTTTQSSSSARSPQGHMRQLLRRSPRRAQHHRKGQTAGS